MQMWSVAAEHSTEALKQSTKFQIIITAIGTDASKQIIKSQDADDQMSHLHISLQTQNAPFICSNYEIFKWWKPVSAAIKEDGDIADSWHSWKTHDKVVAAQWLDVLL